MNRSNLTAWRTVQPMVITILSLLTLATFVSAQTTVAVAPTKLNVLYIGVDNPVAIAAAGTPDEKVTVSISGGGGIVSKTATGLYNVRVASVTDNCQVQVYADGVLAGTSSFRVRTLPAPYATVGGFSSGTSIAADVFRSQPGVGIVIKDFPFELKYQVLSFTLTVPDEKGAAKSVDCEGASFSPLAKQYLDQYATPGQIVTISKIRVAGADGREIKLPALLYTIK